MARCRVDKQVERVEIEGFGFPLGVYPIEPMQPRPGYTVTFEPADGDGAGGEGGGGGASGEGGFGGIGGGGGGGRAKGDEADAPDNAGGLADAGEGAGGVEGEGGEGEGGDWEEWPDRYVFDVLVPASRVESLCRTLFAMLPGRVFPIVDMLGQDEYREVDPYVAYELVGLEQFLDGVRRFNGFFFEDGLVGFGVMCEEPFIYIFIDEHKIVTVRVETALREKVESILAAFDLQEIDEIAGADAATHEHRGVLDSPDDRPDLLNAEEIVEYLRERWRLVLNIDPETNVNEEGEPVGVTGWRCLVRHDWEIPLKEAEAARSAHQTGRRPEVGRYAEVFLTAGCYREAEDLALAEFKSMLSPSLRKIWEQDEEAPDVPVLVAADRLRPDHFKEELAEVRGGGKGAKAGVGGGGGGKAAKADKLNMNERRVWHAAWLPLDT